MSDTVRDSVDAHAPARRWWWGVGLALLGGALWTLDLQWAQQGERTPTPFGVLLLLELPPWLVWIVALPAMSALLDRIPFRRGSLLRAILAHLGLAAASAFATSLLRLPALIAFAPSSANPLRLRFIALELLPHDVSTVWLLYLGLLAALTAVRFHDEVQSRARKAAELEAELANATLRALRMQLDPHFIFNALQNISVMIDENPAAARRTIAELGELLRTTLAERGHLVPLQEEIDFVRRYLALEEARFENRLRVTIDLDALATDCSVPPFLLQPLVENALRHGLAPRAGPGTLQITARLRDNDLIITVRDDGLTIDADAPEGIGLSVTRERLARLFPGPPWPASLSLRAREGGGTEAKIRIPASSVTGKTV